MSQRQASGSGYVPGPHVRAALGGQPQPIIIHDHDVLSGRGINIAHHPGNQRFRTLVTTRADANYCTHYSASEKRAVAEEIIKHIKALHPPGRFLKKDTRFSTSQKHRGLQGPWMELSQREAVKKTCQALRDCNRMDREGYASGVAMPEDVLKEANQRAQLGLSGKQQAAAAVAAFAQQNHQSDANATTTTTTTTMFAGASVAAAPPPAVMNTDTNMASLKRPAPEPTDWGRVSPSVENAAEWLKKQRTDDTAMATAAAAAAAVSDFSPHDEAAVAAANAVNDLLTSTPNEDDDDDADIAEAAEVVASITADTLSEEHGGYRSTNTTTGYELSLSAPEEALAREMAAAGGLMSGGTQGLPLTTTTTGGGEGLYQPTTNTTNTTTTNQALHEPGGLNMHNINEL